jgi:hypothetical protein
MGDPGQRQHGNAEERRNGKAADESHESPPVVGSGSILSPFCAGIQGTGAIL